MAWTAPMTAVANTAFTAAQFNSYIRDNLNETAPAKATTAGRIFVATGANAIVERAIESATVDTAENTTSTSFADLTTPGPSVTVTTGIRALIIVTAQTDNATAGSNNLVGVTISGATTEAAADATALLNENSAASEPNRSSVIRHHTGLTAGSNTFKLQYRVSGGTGTFQRRHIIVIGL